jgi:CheY-like chemotaxis protein
MSKSIMIVEDDQTFHDIYTEMLENKDYRLIHVYDGDEALLKLEQEKPDLIILDIVLDMMTGDTFFLYLKGMPECADIPVIIVTNSSKRAYESLWEIDPDLVILEKTAIGENLVAAIEAKIGDQNSAQDTPKSSIRSSLAVN